MRKVFQAVSMFVLVLACGGNQSGESGTAGSDTVPEYTLAITDSIGIESGDSAYVFGAIADVRILSDGNLIVLDGTYCNARIFSPDGRIISTIGNRGQGPGELIHPFSLYNWNDGTIGIMDPNNGGIHRYSLDTGEWLGLDLEVNHNIPVNPVVVGENTYVSFKTRFEPDGDVITARAFVGLFPMTVEPELMYWQETVIWDPGDMGNIALKLFFSNFFTADPETGTVYVAPFSGDNYTILCLNSDGISTGTITRECTPVSKTAEEIQEEKEFMEFFLRRSEANNPDLNYTCDPWPNYLPVTGLYMGPDGNLWAKRGGTDVAEFDIWNTDLELAATASIPEIPGRGSTWKMTFGEDYAVAWNENPEEFQKLYILEIMQ